MGIKQRLKLTLLFSLHFQFCLERCVSSTPLKQQLRYVSCYIHKQLPSWLREQRREVNSMDITSDEGKLENEICTYSDYKEEQNAFNQIQLQIDVYG